MPSRTEPIVGLVSEVAPLPDPGMFSSANAKVYTTRIQIGAAGRTSGRG